MRTMIKSLRVLIFILVSSCGQKSLEFDLGDVLSTGGATSPISTDMIFTIENDFSK